MTLVEDRSAASTIPQHVADHNTLHEKANVWVDPREYDAVGDGDTDDTEAIQDMVDDIFDFGAAGIGTAGVQVAPGEYVLTDTVTFNRLSGSFLGAGIATSPAYNEGRASVFAWEGANDRPMFKVTDSRWFTIGNMRFQGDNTTPPTYAIEFNNPGGANSGTNEWLMCRDMVIGKWPWVYETGADTGAVKNGIGFTGDNGNNDQMFIERCQITANEIGIELVNAQSVWGKITDVVFDACGTGFYGGARSLLVNPGFNGCDLDIYTEQACEVININSEATGKLAEVTQQAKLKLYGGRVQTGTVITGGGVLIDAWPSDSQTVLLEGVEFTEMTSAAACLIQVGPGDGSSPVGRFYLKVDACDGLTPSNIDLQGSFWAAAPKSQGTIEWWSREGSDIHQFRNILENGGRTTINTGVWDVPSA